MKNYISFYVHFIFRTKNSESLLSQDIREHLFPYMAGIGNDYQMPVLMSGGIEDHIHLLASMPSNLSLGDAAQYFKGGTSRWLNKNFKERIGPFAWQTGYGAFSVSVSHLEQTKQYIANQPEHHNSISTNDEIKAICQKHGIADSF